MRIPGSGGTFLRAGAAAVFLRRTVVACVVVFAALCRPLPALAAEPVLRVGFFELPPHAQMQQNQPSGYAIAYFNLIAQQMGVTPLYVQLPLARLLVSSDIDMVLFLGKTPERAQSLVFAHKPWMPLQGALAVRTDSPLHSIHSADDLRGLHIGAWNAGLRSELMRDPRLHITPISGEDFLDRALTMVARGHIDGFYNPEVFATQAGIQRLGLASQVRVVNLPPSTDALYPAFTAAAAPRYLQRFEAAFEAVERRIGYSAFLLQPH